MSLLLLVASLLFGTQPCEPGTLTLYEDMSYTITPSESALVCNIELEEWDNGAGIDYWQLTLIDPYTVRVDHILYTMGEPFPESIIIETGYYWDLAQFNKHQAPAYDSVRLGEFIYSL